MKPDIMEPQANKRPPAARDETSSLEGISFSLVVAAALLLVIVLGALAVNSARSFERALAPQLEANADVIADLIATQVERAVGAGVPLDRLNGFTAFAEATLADHPEIVRIDVRGTGGSVLFAAGDSPLGDAPAADAPIMRDGVAVGSIGVSVAPGYVGDRLREIQGDVTVLFLVALFLTIEVVLVVVALFVAEPVRRLARLFAEGERGALRTTVRGESADEIGRIVRAFNALVRAQQARLAALERRIGSAASPELRTLTQQAAERLRSDSAGIDGLGRSPADVRMPLFLFFFSTELSRSFLPLFARDLYEPVGFVSYEIAIAAPIALYLFFVAVLTPFAGALTARVGSRRMFLYGLVPTIVGLGMTATAQDLGALVLWRCVNAVGFAAATIAALDYIASATGPKRRAEGMGLYTAAFVTAGLCGASIGGILADRLGYHTTFLFAAGIAILSALMLLVTLEKDDPRTARNGVALTVADFITVLRNRRFQTLILGAAAPTQLLTTGFLFYTIPMLLDDFGYSPSVIGQVLMSYFVAMILLGVPIARLVDRSGHYGVVVGAGLVIAGVAALLPNLAAGSPHFQLWAMLAVGLVGVGQAMCIPAQGALLLGEAERLGGDRRTAAIAAYRVLERIGSVAGPVLAATLASIYGFAPTASAFGAFVIVCGVVFATMAALATPDPAPNAT